MYPLIANMFPEMALLPLIVFFVGVFAFVVFSGIFFIVLHKVFSIRRQTACILGVILGVAPIISIIIWAMYYISPLQLPKEASEVKIKRASPATLEIDDNLRFRVSEAVFRSWMETLCRKSWQTIQSSPEFSAFKSGHYTIVPPDGKGQSRVGEKFSYPKGYFNVSWMNPGTVKNGYFLQGSEAFYGEILYDSDKELVYYSFWD